MIESAVVQTWHSVAWGDPPGVRWAALKGKFLEGGWAASPFELVETVRYYEGQGYGLYVQPNPSSVRHGRRTTGADITHWSWFLVDVDPTDPKDNLKEQALYIGDAVRIAVENYTGAPADPAVIYSGRGVQVWFRLAPRRTDEMHYIKGVDLWGDPPIRVKSTIPVREAAVRAQRFWLGQLARRIDTSRYVVDPSVSDLPRLMRLPGSVNPKTGETAVLWRLGSLNGGLSEKLLGYAPDSAYWTPTVGQSGSLPDGAPWQTATGITRSAADFITYGAREPGRHRACSGAARSLAEQGLSYEEVLKALRLGAMRSSPEIDDHEYLERTARDAVDRHAVHAGIKNDLDNA